MNIAVFSDTYLPQVNGVASSLGLLREQFLNLGHQVTIFIPEIKEAGQYSDDVIQIKSVQVSKNPAFYIGSPVSPQIWPILKHRKFNIIHAHTPLTMGMLAYQAANMLRQPLIYTYHTMLPGYLHYIGLLSKIALAKKFIKYFDQYSCNICDLIIAPSIKVKKFLDEAGVSTISEVVPNGVRLHKFKGIQKGFLRSHSNIDTTDKILLFVGRLAPEKNPAFLLSMFVHILQKIDGVKLVFAGSGYLLAKLQQQAEQLQISSNVIFLGNVSFTDMPALYADTDIFVSAATTEVHPMSLLEAISSGLPVVAVNDEAFTSAVINGKNGYLTVLKEAAFADRVEEILQSSAIQQAMSIESLKISEQFSIETQVNKLLDIYSNLIANKDMDQGLRLKI